ncbi:hypothetical protein B0T20DRAFT_399208 [Sordaria brevicollis]|uniref:Uncharacterized protein n=1 Tax=Sordaria brevicollis TaxID=83679 RepID=A0AAE0PMJ2_SORBR|nr:hypothetical protein B0T20DRAFT_399208 [Sordaria brevicollis]
MQWRAAWGLKCYHRYILDYLSIIQDMRRRSAEKMTSPDEDEIYRNKSDPTRRNQAIWRVPIGDCYTNGPGNRGRAKPEDVRPVFAELIDHCKFCCEKDEELRELRREWKEQQQDQKQKREEQQKEQDEQNNNETKTEPQPELDPETQNFLADRWDELQSKGSYLDNMIHMDKMRPYLTEKKGYIGMAPAHAQPGDVVVLLCGDSIPYVLRPVVSVSRSAATGAGVGGGGGGDGDEEGNEENREEKEEEIDGKKYYTFVGEAYCDGIMDGELEGRLETERENFYLV